MVGDQQQGEQGGHAAEPGLGEADDPVGPVDQDDADAHQAVEDAGGDPQQEDADRDPGGDADGADVVVGAVAEGDLADQPGERGAATQADRRAGEAITPGVAQPGRSGDSAHG